MPPIKKGMKVMYVLAECGLVHKYLLKKEDIKRIEEETFLTVTVVKELDGHQIVEGQNKIILNNGSETLVFKKAERKMWDFVYYLDEYNFKWPVGCRNDISENKKEVAPEVPVREQPRELKYKLPPQGLSYREELSYELKNQIHSKVMEIFAANNLTIGECREILAEISDRFENCRPWR